MSESEGARQPSHLAILRELSAVGARMDAKFEAIEKRMDSGDIQRSTMIGQLHAIDTRTTVLESQGEQQPTLSLPLPPPPKTKLEAIGMWAGLIVGLPTIATVLQVLWGSIGHFITGLAERTP